MMRYQGMLCAGLALVAAGSMAGAQVVADFEDGQNLGGWTFGNAFESIQPGGNPGMHLRNTNIDTYAPQPFNSAPGSAFEGDYRALGVSSIGVDLITYQTQWNFERELSLVLHDGTCSVAFTGTSRVPKPGEGWKSFSFEIDAASPTLPAGWSVYGGCDDAGVDADAIWNSVITNVTYVVFLYGHPQWGYIFDIWDIGMDNVRLDFGVGTSFCSGDGSGAACPCGNQGPAGEGCLNSSLAGGQLSAAGSASVSADDLTFSASGLLPSQQALLFVGTSALAGGAGVPFGDGLRCAGGNPLRLGAVQTSAQGSAGWGPGLGSGGAFVAGDTRYFQAWYRDSSGGLCGTGSNLTQGLSVTFLP